MAQITQAPIKTSVFRPLLLALVAASILSGCGESSSSTAGSNYDESDTPTSPTPPPVDTTFNQTALLTNIADNIITPTYQAFKTLAVAQQIAVSDYCSSETNYVAGTSRDDVELALTSAQTSWQAAMNMWQQADVMQVGPLSDNSSILRNNIYSYPLVSSCGVDLDVMVLANSSNFDISNRVYTRRGLDSLEYLLFNTELNHSCQSNPTSLSTWSNMSVEYRRIARCNLAEEVSTDLVNSADLLLTQWLGDNGYAQKLKQAGNAGSVFATAHDGVNAVSDAMFYLDKWTKDLKLAVPLGYLDNDCFSGTCPQNVESPYSDNSISNLINNLKGFEKLFSGQGSDTNNTIGFDDYLIEQQDSTTSSQLAANTQTAISSLEALNSTLATTLTQDVTKVAAVHSQVKTVTDQLKADFINSLALQLPATAAGDND